MLRGRFNTSLHQCCLFSWPLSCVVRWGDEFTWEPRTKNTEPNIWGYWSTKQCCDRVQKREPVHPLVPMNFCNPLNLRPQSFFINLDPVSLKPSTLNKKHYRPIAVNFSWRLKLTFPSPRAIKVTSEEPVVIKGNDAKTQTYFP